MTSKQSFSLRKWYLDCVAPDGEVVILYHAELQWHRIQLHYSSMLRYTEPGGTSVRTSLRSVAPPVGSTDCIEWRSKALGIEGSWKRIAPSVDVMLLESPEGDIRWNCTMPKGEVELAVEGARPIAGLGYVECLEMTLKPWQMPIKELRWGRFLSDSDSAVWIEWKGSLPRKVLYHNGLLVDASVITEHQIHFDNRTLLLTEPAVLREGPLVSTALAAIPGIARLFPGHILDSHEIKWRSHGQLHSPLHPSSAGWAIHEVVRWRQ